MSKYEKIKKLSESKFKRLVGVKKKTFENMLVMYTEYHNNKKSKGGSPNRLCVADQILVMLEYYREYRTQAHIGFDYGVSEPTVSRIIFEVESVLIKSGKFSLPGKKELYQGDDLELEYICIDATECTVQRPKKK